jgi:hypothetical protein
MENEYQQSDDTTLNKEGQVEGGTFWNARGFF